MLHSESDPPMTAPPPQTHTFEVELPDAFIDLMFGAAAMADDELNEMEQRIHDEINEALGGNLSMDHIPRLPAAAADLVARLNDPETTADEVVKLVEKDPNLIGAVLKMSNSAHFHRGDKEVTNLKQAAVTVGFNGLRSMVINALMRPTINIRPIYYKLFGQQLWDHSEDCARACAAIAKRQGVDTFDAYLLGLIHDVGKIALFQMIVAAFRTMDPDIRPRPYVFLKLILSSARHLSLRIAEEWELPEVHRRALHAHANLQNPMEMPMLARVLFYGNLLSEAQLVRRRNRFPAQALERFLHQNGLKVDMLDALFGEN